MIDLTLYDIMGEDHELNAYVNSKTGKVIIEIFDENALQVYDDETHPRAWESLVIFAKQVIAADKRIQNHLDILEE